MTTENQLQKVDQLNYTLPHAYAVLVPDGISIGELDDLVVFVDRGEARGFINEIADAVRDKFDRDLTEEERIIFTLYAAKLTP